MLSLNQTRVSRNSSIHMALVFCVWAMVTSLQAAKHEELTIGSPAPTWKLHGTDGKQHSRDDLKEKSVIVVVFTCHSCPISCIYEERLVSLAEAFKAKSVGFVAINPNETTDLAQMQAHAKKQQLPYAYLHDEKQEVAKSFGARMTPEVFLLNQQRKLVYHGAIDDDVTLTGKPRNSYLKDAIEAVLSDREPKQPTTRAIGCRIKWK